MPSIELTPSEEAAMQLIWTWMHDWIAHECAKTRKIEEHLFSESIPVFMIRSLLVGLGHDPEAISQLETKRLIAYEKGRNGPGFFPGTWKHRDYPPLVISVDEKARGGGLSGYVYSVRIGNKDLEPFEVDGLGIPGQDVYLTPEGGAVCKKLADGSVRERPASPRSQVTGLPASCWKILKALYENRRNGEPMDRRGLAKAAALSERTVTKHATALRGKGFVQTPKELGKGYLITKDGKKAYRSHSAE